MEIKTTGLTKLTKPELIKLIKSTAKAYQQLAESSDLNEGTSNVLKAGYDEMAKALKKARVEIEYLKQELSKAQVQLENVDEEGPDIKAKYESLLELKNTLFDGDGVGRILIDSQYIVQCINDAAVRQLHYTDPARIQNQKIFEIFDYDHGMKLKKRIDKVLLERESEKFKDIYSRVPSGQLLKLKGKIKPAQFRNMPAVLIKLK